MGQSSRHPYSAEWKAGFQAAHASLKNFKERNSDDISLFGLAELDSLLASDEGYVRIGHGKDGLFWARWKWTKGVLEGRYCFSSHVSLGVALAEVVVAAREVESGKRTASIDRGYKSKSHP